MENLKEKVYGLLSKFDTAMLITQGQNGESRARPMAIARVDDNCDVWFFTQRGSEKTHEVENDHSVLLAFQNDHSCYVSLSGRATLKVDQAKTKELWKESYKTWFPGGADDPSLLLIQVTAIQAEYWDNTGLRGMKYLFEAAKAYVTGQTPKVDEPDHHGKTSL